MRIINIEEDGKQLQVIANNEDHIADAFKLRIEKLEDWKFSYYGLKERWQFLCVTDLPDNIVGMCNYEERAVYINTNKLYLLTWDMVKYVMLHEIAHALTPNCKKNGGHGKYWHNQCFKMCIPTTVTLGRKLIPVGNNFYKVEYIHYIPIELKDNDYPDLPW